MTIIATIGATALWLMYAWLLAAICGAYMSNRKGYGERPGLASGVVAAVIGTAVWSFIPAREDSVWKHQGPGTLGMIISVLAPLATIAVVVLAATS
jgi:hypothetical protein